MPQNTKYKIQATMPHGVKTLVFLLAGLLVAVARAQDYYDDYLDPQVMRENNEQSLKHCIT